MALVFLLFAQPAAGSEGEKPPDQRRNEDRSTLEWWLGSDRAEIGGYADGRRVKKHGNQVEELRDDRLGIIETEDGELFEATEQGRVLQVGRSARRASRETVVLAPPADVSSAPPEVAAATASRHSKTDARPETKRQVAGVAAPLELLGLGQSAFGMLLRLCAVILFLRAILSWVDVSYSYASLMRFGVVVMVLGELSLLLLSGGLHAG